VGNTNGVLVTTIGYQKGAKKFAEVHGINLIVLRKPKTEDWNGRVKIIDTNVEAINQIAKKWFVQLDYDWCKANLLEEQMNSIEINISGMNNEIWIYDTEKNKVRTFLELQDSLPINKERLFDNEYFYEFENKFIKSENYGLIKIKGIQIKYDTIVDKSSWRFDAEKTTKAILENVTTGEMKFIKKATHNNV